MAGPLLAERNATSGQVLIHEKPIIKHPENGAFNEKRGCYHDGANIDLLVHYFLPTHHELIYSHFLSQVNSLKSEINGQNAQRLGFTPFDTCTTVFW